MSHNERKPSFMMLGYNLQKVNFTRINNDSLEQINVFIQSKEYNNDSNIYSIVLGVELNFKRSKNNRFEFLAGFEINDKQLIEDNNINEISIFCASLFPFVRTHIANLTSDSRHPIILPTIDLRYIDVEKTLTLDINKKL